MRCVFDVGRKVIKIFNSKIKGNLWKVVKYLIMRVKTKQVNMEWRK